MARGPAGLYRRVDWETRGLLAAPEPGEETLIVSAERFPPEGEDCDAVLVRRAYDLGWRRFICHGYRGQRFTGCGLGPATDDVRIDVYGSSGDYLGSGIDGLSIFVHGNGQDQLGQIMNRGKLVVYGDVGQTFLYGAKGGEVYVLGQRGGPPADQRRRPPARRHQRHLPRLPRRVVHGRRPAGRRRLC